MNNYHIYEKIGKGQHSVVYKGRKKKTIQYFAIKSVDKSQKARVMQEVRTMHALDHRNILKFHAWYETSNHLWLILEYCVGGDLLSILNVDSRLPESSVHDFARDLVIALQYLHSNSIVYCDLKPSNILLDENGRLKLGGFGLSRRLHEIKQTPVGSLPEPLRGTPAYMAPELFSEGATHSTASDLWSLGCVMYECATGRPPYMNSSLQQLVTDILNKDPPPVPGASPEFSNFLSRLLDKNPATRMNWRELVEHRFWQGSLPWLEMPPEPALEEFIQRHNLAPVQQDARDQTQAVERAKAMRQSVDITRLSRIALNNLEKDSDVRQTRNSDVHLENPDTELTFQEQEDDAMDDDEGGGVEEVGVIDQGTPSQAAEGSGRVDLGASMSSEAMMTARQNSHLGASSRAVSTTSSSQGSAGGHYSEKDSSIDMDADAGSPLTEDASIDTLMWHPSDSAVKPIVANRRIERLPDPRWEARSLGFPALTLQQMMGSPQAEKEAFLTQIYRSVASAAPLKDKVNVLAYFETLCGDTDAANLLVNSCLATLFVKLLKSAKAPTLRIRLASVLGLMVRHATFINADDLAPSGIVEVLAEALQDRNERVRRRVMATLGELLFYIATQQQEAAASTVGASSVRDTVQLWGITTTTTTLVGRLLRAGEDEITQHYAVKTIENICSQPGEWATRFCSQEVAHSLAQIYSGRRGGEHLTATAASTLARVLRVSPAIIPSIIDKFGIRILVQGLSDTSSKVQAAACNTLNLALLQPDLTSRARASLAEERPLLPSLLTLLDSSLPLLRVKACCSLVLLCRLGPRWLLEACKLKVIPVVERLARDSDEGLRAATNALRVEVGMVVPSICAGITEEINRLVPRRFPSGSSPARTPPQKASPLSQLPVLLHLVVSPYFRAVVVTPQLVADLAAYVTSTSVTTSAFPGLADFKDNLKLIVEALCQQPELVSQQHQALLEHLLPALCEVVRRGGEGGDTRLFCLRVVSEVVQLCLLDPQLYPSGGGGQDGGEDSASAALIHNVLTRHVLPLVPTVLEDEDPMPLLALKLMSGLLETNQQYAEEVGRLGLASQLFDFLSLEHRNNNVHNIRLCRQLVASGVLGPRQLQDMQVADKVIGVYSYAYSKNVEPFLEPVLGLCCAVIELASHQSDDASAAILGAFLRHLPSFVSLCGVEDAAVSQSAAACTSVLVMLYPEWMTSWVVSEDGARLMLEALQGDPSQPPNTHTQHQLLEALASALSPGRVDVPSAGPPHALSNACRQISEVSEPDLARLAVRCEDLFAALADSAPA